MDKQARSPSFCEQFPAFYVDTWPTFTLICAVEDHSDPLLLV